MWDLDKLFLNVAESLITTMVMLWIVVSLLSVVLGVATLEFELVTGFAVALVVVLLIRRRRLARED